jgi:membrane fusion protein (multidrug efflux system)
MQINTRRLLSLALTAAALASSAACEKPVAPAPPPPQVYVASVVQQDVPEYLDLVGQTEGYQDVEIRARVEGFLESMQFREGTFVRAGELLYEIDRKPLETSLAQAVADKATAQARLEKTGNDVARYTPLVTKQAVSRQELDDATSAQQASRSQVEAASAAVEKAKLDLGYTRVTSPISGLAGATLVKPGNLVGKGEPTLLTTVSQIDPILFRVGVTEAEFLRLTKRYADRVGKPSRTAGIQLQLADGSTYADTGRVRAIDRAVNPTTGTIGIQLEFPNRAFILRPGQYGRVRVLVDVKKNALLVPQRAVQELQGQYSVATVTPEQKIVFRNVKVGPRVDTLWVIDEGVKTGEQVVAEGLQSIRDGVTVRTKPFDTSSGAAEAAN